MSVPSATVVLSVRNGAEFLGRSIASVLAQDGVELELLIYDNGSTDGSLEIAEAFLADPRVTHVRNPDCLRFPDSMNLGLARASGEFFVPWACDDEMLPGNLARKAEALRTVGAGLAFGGWLLDRGDGELRTVVLPAMGDEPRLLPVPSLFPLIATANAIAMPTVVLRTDALREADGFDVRPELTCDWQLWLRLALRVGAVWLPEPLVLYREHEANGSQRAWTRGTFATELVATASRALEAERFPAEWEPHREQILTGVAVQLADGLAKHGHRTLADSPYPAHAALGDVLTRFPHSLALRDLYCTAVSDAGLAPPALPALAVAAPTWTPDAVGGAVRSLRALADGGLVDGCAIAVSAADLDAAVALLEPELEQGPEIGLDLVVCEQPLEALRPGSVFVARWGDALATQAESMGVPALTYGMPTPYDAER
jgi:hypothetical protein